MNKTPALLSGSCGKDSALALFHARANGLDVRWQVTMLEETGERSRSHGLPPGMDLCGEYGGVRYRFAQLALA
jgi:diphthamide synthase (EF-2-diphthine--ammonia ligase)